MSAVIRTVGLGFVYPDGTRALRGVNLEIAAGQRVAIIGQNGSGKSTLIRHFNGLLRATEGTVEVMGRPVTGRRVAELAREVGIAFQNPDRQIFAGRVASEVAFGPRNLGLDRHEVERRVERSLASVRLEDRRDANPYDLTYSERKLLALASILAMETPVVVLDEPTTGQDARGVGCVRAIVEGLAAEGRTVITISHDMRFVTETAERVIVMREGEVVADGTPARVFAEDHWELLDSTHLHPPLPARIGARAGLGSTPTDAALIEALRARASG